MENRKSYVLTLAISVALGVFFSAQSVAAYEVNTHAYLTKESIEVYNKYTEENKIPDELKRYIIDGVIHEDDDPRYKNHFYDPIDNEGLNDVFRGVSAKEWVNDEKSQSSIEYKPGAKTSLTPIDQEKIDKYGNVTNFTWNAALRYWLKGDKEMAMETLGHVLHLIEDMGVPEHTRNDSHARGSRYEEYASRYNSDTPDEQLSERLGDKKFVSLRTLDSYFNGLAKYSNKYFYSPGSLGMYDFPEVDYKNAETREGKYYITNKDDEGTKYYLAIKKNIANIALGYTDVFVDREPVLDSYWNLLSVRTVRYGAGVIDLFFRDVEKAKNDPDFLKEEAPRVGVFEKASTIAGNFWGGVKSVAVKTGTFLSNVFSAIGNRISSGASFIGGLFANDNGLTDVGNVDQMDSELNTGGNTQVSSNGSSATPTPKSATTKKNDEIAALKLQIEQLQKEAQIQDKAVLALEKKQPEVVESDEQIATTTNKSSTKKADAPLCSYTLSVGFGQKGIIINEVAWMGGARSASDEWIELKNVSNGDIDLSGWQLLNKGGGIKIRLDDLKNTVIKPGQFVLLERTDNNSAVGAAVNLIYSGALGNSNDGLKLFNDSCGVVDEVAVAAHWPAGNNDSKQTMERNAAGSGWHTSSSAGGTPKKENSSGMVYSTGGGGAVVSPVSTRSTQNGVGGDPTSAAPQFYPVVINEIMYDLPGTDSDREWIELYNGGSAAADISDWKLFENDTNHALAIKQGNSSIPAGGYAIVAENKDSFLQDNSGFVGAIFESAFSLNNDGEQLVIKNSTLTIDTITYASSTGAQGDEMSLQKFNDRWLAASSTPGRVNVKQVAVEITQESLSSTTTATTSQSIHDAASGSLNVMAYYQSLATSTSHTVGSFSVYGSGIAGRWKGGVCEFNPAVPRCTEVLAQSFADIDMPGGDSETLLTFGFSTLTALDMGKQYALFVEPTGNVHIKDRVSRIKGSATDTYVGGKLSAFGQYEPYYISEAIDLGLKDMYFSISSDVIATSQATSTEEMSPSDNGGSTSTTETISPQFYPIVINEIMYDLPGADDGREWIELYNSGTTTADIADWKFYEDETNHGLMVKQGSSAIPVGGYAVIVNDGIKFLEDNSGFTGAMFDSAFSLSNEGEILALKNGDLVIDTTVYSSSVGAQGNGMSLQKFDDGWHVASSTPGMENVLAPIIIVPEATSTSATTTEPVDEVATSTESAPVITGLSQLDHSARSTPAQATAYIQTLGKGMTNEIRSIKVYVESDQALPWTLGICKLPEGNAAKCLQNVIESAAAPRSVSEANVKTLLVFDLSAPLILDANSDYALYVKPIAGASWPSSSVYGISGEAYANGALWEFKGVEQLTPGIGDMYFEVQ